MQKEHRDLCQKASSRNHDTNPDTNQPNALNVEFMQLDLESLASTMEFVNAYKAKGYPLHVLVCNAGIAYVPYGEWI